MRQSDFSCNIKTRASYVDPSFQVEVQRSNGASLERLLDFLANTDLCRKYVILVDMAT